MKDVARVDNNGRTITFKRPKPSGGVVAGRKEPKMKLSYLQAKLGLPNATEAECLAEIERRRVRKMLDLSASASDADCEARVDQLLRGSKRADASAPRPRSLAASGRPTGSGIDTADLAGLPQEAIDFISRFATRAEALHHYERYKDLDPEDAAQLARYESRLPEYDPATR